MRFLEVVVQGIPGTQGVLRYPFEPGWNAWKQKGTLPLSVLLELVLSLLFSSTDSSKTFGPHKARQAGMTLEMDEVVYRITRDYVAGEIFLAQKGRSSSEPFQTIGRGFLEVRKILEAHPQWVPKMPFLFLFISKLGETLFQPFFLSENSVLGDSSKEPALSSHWQTRLEELKKEIQNQETLQKLGQELDDLHRDLDQTNEHVLSFSQILQKKEILVQELKSFEKVNSVVPSSLEILPSLGTYRQRCEKKILDLSLQEEKEEELHQKISQISHWVFWKSKMIGLGSFLTLAGFLGANEWGYKESNFVWLALGVLFSGLGLLMVELFHWKQRQDQKGELQKQKSKMAYERKLIERKFQEETQKVQNVLAGLNLSDPDEVMDLLKSRDQLREEMVQLENFVKELEEKGTLEEWQNKKRNLEQQIGEIQDRLSQILPPGVDPEWAKKEIQRLEILQRDGFLVSFSEGQVKDDLNELIQCTAQILSFSSEEVLLRIQSLIGTNIEMFTHRQFVGIEVLEGRIVGCKTLQGKICPWPSISPKEKVSVLFSLQFSCWQVLAQKRSIPVIVDFSDRLISEEFAQEVFRAARILSSKTQVLLLGI